jgi:hypothetical protein
MIQFPGKTAWGFVFEPTSSTSSITPNFGPPNNNLTNPLFGHSTQTLASSLGSGGANGGFNPLYQIGGPAPSSSPASSNSKQETGGPLVPSESLPTCDLIT